MKHDLNEQELAGLSEAEREAVLADASEDEKAVGGQDTSASVAAETEMKPEAKVDEPAKPEGKPEAKADEPAKADAEVVTEAPEKEPFAVPFHHTAAIKPEEAKAKLDALLKQYDDGEIEQAEFLAKRDAIQEVVITDRVATKISAASQEQTAFAIWTRSVEDFLDTHTAYKDPILKDALDSRVKSLALDPKNESLSDRQLLTKAHDEVRSRMKVDEPTPTDAKAALAARRAPDLSNAPKTLATAPAAADNGSADDEFAHLDKLAGDSQALESALAKMNPEAQDRYLRGVAA